MWRQIACCARSCVGARVNGVLCDSNIDDNDVDEFEAEDENSYGNPVDSHFEVTVKVYDELCGV